LSHSEVSKAAQQLRDAVEAWRQRDLSQEKIKYIVVDGVTFLMRINGSIERVPVLVAIGIREDGRRTVLGLQAGDKESASSWREFFKDLKRRGLDLSRVELGIMDGLPGLEKVFGEEFPKARIQRCQLHVSRNVLAKVPRKLKKIIADDLRSIFYASSREKALEFFEKFKARWEKEIPSAVKCLEKSLDHCLTYLDFPEEEWVSLRGDPVWRDVLLYTACFHQMEVNWQSKPIGKAGKGLPSLRRLAEGNFTQNS